MPWRAESQSGLGKKSLRGNCNHEVSLESEKFYRVPSTHGDGKGIV